MISATVIGPLSIFSSIFDRWILNGNTCKLLAYISYALWLIDISSLFWLSVDRYLYITDIKYNTYKMRTKARSGIEGCCCFLRNSYFPILPLSKPLFIYFYIFTFRFICKIVMSWFVSAVYSFAPIVANTSGKFLKNSFVCTLNWLNFEPYYITVTVIIILPCFFGTIYNFARIFLMRLIYQSNKCFKKLAEADVEYLMDPSHKMSVLLVILFWISWSPYIFHLITENFYETVDEPTFFQYWTGKFGKLPILTIFFPRYREYFRCLFGIHNKERTTPLHFKRFENICDQVPSHQDISHQFTEHFLYI